MNQIFSVLLALTGAAAMAAGIYWSHRLRSPLDILPAAGVVAGICAFIAGVLLTVIPGFFVT